LNNEPLDIKAYLEKLQESHQELKSTQEKLDRTQEKLDRTQETLTLTFEQLMVQLHQSSFVILGNWFLAALEKRGLSDSFKQTFPESSDRTDVKRCKSLLELRNTYIQ
jgi:hypothetical protein